MYEGKKAAKTCTDEQRKKVKELIEQYVSSEPKGQTRLTELQQLYVGHAPCEWPALELNGRRVFVGPVFDVHSPLGREPIANRPDATLDEMVAPPLIAPRFS